MADFLSQLYGCLVRNSNEKSSLERDLNVERKKNHRAMLTVDFDSAEKEKLDDFVHVCDEGENGDRVETIRRISDH